MQVHFKGEDLWFAFYGLDPKTGEPAYVDAEGQVAPSRSGSPISFPVPKEMPFPPLNAARLYLSVGKPLVFPIDAGGHPIPPQSANPGDPNYTTPWDFFEVTYIPLAGTTGLFNFNLSNVQSANLPLSFQVQGEDPSTRKPVSYQRGWLPGGYKKLLSLMRETPDFSGLILPDSQRILAPGTAITAYTQGVLKSPLFREDYLEDYVRQVWSRFEREDLSFVGDPPPGSNDFVPWTGRVHNGQFTFTTKHPGLEPIVLNKPTTADLFENNFLFCASGRGKPGTLQENYGLQLFGTLCAAFNRSVMLTVTTLANSSDCEWCKATGTFYQDPTTNHYAKGVHGNSKEGLAYAFQSDDHCDVSSYVSLVNPTGLHVGLTGRSTA